MNETDRARTSEKIAAIRDSNSKYHPIRRPLNPYRPLILSDWPNSFTKSNRSSDLTLRVFLFAFLYIGILVMWLDGFGSLDG